MTSPLNTSGLVTSAYVHSMVTNPYIVLGICEMNSPGSNFMEFYVNVDGSDMTFVDIYYWFGANTVFNAFSVYYLAIESNWRAIFTREWMDLSAGTNRKQNLIKL